MPLWAGDPLANSAMSEEPTGWWLRPVSNDTRLGEHSAVVWKFR